MRYPKLVRNARTPCEVTISTEDIDEDGAPVLGASFSGLCNFQSVAKTIRKPDATLVSINGIVLIDGDIAPNLAEIASGYVAVFGLRRSIVSGSKCRNPDGTVNYTRLELS